MRSILNQSITALLVKDAMHWSKAASFESRGLDSVSIALACKELDINKHELSEALSYAPAGRSFLLSGNSFSKSWSVSHHQYPGIDLVALLISLQVHLEDYSLYELKSFTIEKARVQLRHKNLIWNFTHLEALSYEVFQAVSCVWCIMAKL